MRATKSIAWKTPIMPGPAFWKVCDAHEAEYVSGFRPGTQVMVIPLPGYKGTCDQCALKASK